MGTREEQDYFYNMFDEMWPTDGLPVKSKLNDEITELETRLIIGAMVYASSNKTKAAKELGISRENLIYKLKKLKITV
jgi:transcriptional regulator with PAS, ATPase and Fis domain